jgi:hypothetical protein
MVRQRLRAAEGHFGEGPTFRARAAKPGEQLRSSVDPTKAEDLLGWLRAEAGLAAGQKETLRFFEIIVDNRWSSSTLVYLLW